MSDATFPSGTFALYAGTTARFASASFQVPCGSSCVDPLLGTSCSFQCNQGWQGGRGSRVCNSTDGYQTAQWSGRDTVCTLQPPVLLNAVVSCAEGLAANAACGMPLEATLQAQAVTLSYRIVNQTSNGSEVSAFSIGQCSGQLFVADASKMSADDHPTFSLVVQAFVAEYPSVAMSANITVQLVQVPQAPALPAFQVMNASQSTRPGGRIGAVQVTQLDASAALRWSISADGAGGLFRIDASTGVISLAPAPAYLSWVNQPDVLSGGYYALGVTAALASNVRLSAVATVAIFVTPADNVPWVDDSSLLVIDENAAMTLGGAFTPAIGSARSWTDYDDYPAGAPAFPALVVPPQFALVPPSLAASACSNTNLGFPEPSGFSTPSIYNSGGRPGQMPAPTVNGSSSSVPLFAMDAVSGALTVSALPALAWTYPSRNFSSFFGAIVVQGFQLCVNVTSGPAATSPDWQMQVLHAAVVVSLASRAYVTACASPAFLATGGGDAVVCSVGNPGAGWGAVTATYSNAFTSFTLSCPFSSASSSFTCTTAAGTGGGMTWSFKDPVGANMPVQTPLVTSYQAPYVISAVGTQNVSAAGGSIVHFYGLHFGTRQGSTASAVNATIIVNIGISSLLTGVCYCPANGVGSTCGGGGGGGGGRCSPGASCAYLPPGSPGSQSSDSVISCVVGPGSGAALPVIIDVSGQIYKAPAFGFQPTISYAPPTVTGLYIKGGSLAAPGLSSLSVGGRDIVTIVGNNFGLGLDGIEESVAAGAGAPLGQTVLFASCAHVVGSENTQLNCITPAYTGSNLPVAVRVGMQWSQPTSGFAAQGRGISYAAPTVTAVYGPNNAPCCWGTEGGQALFIEGSGFGGVTAGGLAGVSSIVSVTYGPTPLNMRYEVSASCYVDQAPPAGVNRLNCMTLPGVGQMRYWQVQIGSQISAVFTSLTASYASPSVSALVPQGSADGTLVTRGSQRLLIQGDGFGPMDAYTNGQIAVWMGIFPPPASCFSGFGGGGGGGGGGNFTGGGGGGAFGQSGPPLTCLAYQLTACSVTSAHQAIQCTVPAGSGYNMNVFVTIGGLWSTPPLLSYAAPVVSQILDSATGANLTTLADPNYSYNVTLLGANFGPPASLYHPTLQGRTPGALTVSNVSVELVTEVTFGPSGTEFVALGFTHVSDSVLTVLVGPNSGGSAAGVLQPLYFIVWSGNQPGPASNVGFTYAAPPKIIAVVPPPGYSLGLPPPGCVGFNCFRNLPPNNIPTQAPASGALVVTLVVAAAPVLDPRDQLVVLFGAAPNQFVIPASTPSSLLGLQAATNSFVWPNTTVAGSFNVSFALPFVYAGGGIPIALGLIPRGADPALSSPAPITPQTGFGFGGGGAAAVTWAYASPVVTSVVATAAPWLSVSVGPPVNGSVSAPPVGCPFAANDPVFSCADPKMQQIVVLGSNFGSMQGGLLVQPPASASASAVAKLLVPDGVRKQLLAGFNRSTVPFATSSPAPAGSAPFFSSPANWTDSRIVAYSNQPAAQITVELSRVPCPVFGGGRGGTCGPWSGSGRYAAISPTISAISGDITALPTVGGGQLTMQVFGLEGATNITAFVGGAICPLSDGSATPTLITDPVGQIVNRPINAAEWQVSCIVPPGQGAGMPVTLLITNSANPGVPFTSDTQLAVSYAPPLAAYIAVAEETGPPTNYTAGSCTKGVCTGTAFLTTVLVPTPGAVVTVGGANLGPAPVLRVANGLLLGPTGECAGTTGSHSCWNFRVPPGEGRGAAVGGFQISLAAGNQQSQAAAMGYEPPVVTGFTSSTGSFPTDPRNGTLLNFTGRNFGAANAGSDPGASLAAFSVSFQQFGPSPPAPAPCLSPRRISHWAFTCVLPEGSGGKLTVNVHALDQTGATPAIFSYDAPVINEVWVMALVPPAIAPVCVNETVPAAAGGFTTLRVCQPAPALPAELPDNSTKGMGGSVAFARTTAGGGRFAARPAGCTVARCPIYKVTGGLSGAAGGLLGSYYQASGSTLDMGNLVVIAGANFGPPAPTNCPAMPWSYRPTGAAGQYFFACNGLEDWIGEGEVPSAHVIFWSHTMAVFFTSAGVGLKDFEIVAGSQTAVSKGVDDVKRIRFRYDAPSLFAGGLLPPVFEADGDANYPVQVLASNLGPVPIDFSLAPLATYNGNWLAQPVPALCPADPAAPCGPRMPTAYVALSVGRNCVARALWVDGSAQPAVAGCHGTIRSQTASVVTFVPPSGVGARKQLLIRVIDAAAPQVVADPLALLRVSPELVAQDPLSVPDVCCGFPLALPFAQGSAPVPFSYAAPLLSAISPSTVRVGSVADPANFPVVTIRGYNLGNNNLVGPDFWTAADRQLSISVGATAESTIASPSYVPCLAAWRQELQGPAGVESVLQCQVNASSVGAGSQPVVVSVGGQFTPPFESTLLDVLVTCDTAFFAKAYPVTASDPVAVNRNTEVCTTCPSPGAFCAGGLSYPRPLPGWFNLNSSDKLNAATTRWFPDVPRPSCPHSAWSVQHRYRYDGFVGPDGRSVQFKSGSVVDLGLLDASGVGAVSNRSADSYAAVVPRDTCIVPCPIPSACLGFRPAVPGAASESGLDNYCAEGYVSEPPNFACAACAGGYYRLANACRKCPSAPAVVFIVYCALVLAAVAGAWLAARSGLHLALVTLGVDFMQEVAMLAYSKVAWTPETRGLFLTFSAFYGNVEIVSPECSAGRVRFDDKFFFVMFMPLAAVALMGTVALTLYLYKVFVLRRKSAERARHVPLLVGALLSLWSLIYIYEVGMDLQVFSCSPLSPPTFDAAGKRVNFLTVVHEACSQPGGTWSRLWLFAAAGFAVYVAGFPLGVAAWLWRNRELCMEDQLLRAKGAGADRLSGPQTYEVRKTFGGLYFQFKPDTYYWGVVVLLRKFLFVFVMLNAFAANANYQMSAVLFIYVVAYALHVRVAPYMGPGAFEAVLREHTASALTNETHARLRASIAAVETRAGPAWQRRRLVDFKGQLDRTAVLSVLRGWLFDYNSVEGTLLFGRIIIALMGILVNSDNAVTSAYAGSTLAASLVIMGLATVFVIYFLVIFVADVLVVVAESSLADRRQKAAMAKRRNNKLGDDSGKAGPGGSRRGSRLLATAEQLVDALSTDDVRAQAGAEARRARGAAALEGAPTETSSNPMFALMQARDAGAGSARLALMKQDIMAPPPPPPGAAGPADPGLLEGHLAALQGFGEAPPPASLWPSIRDAAASAMRAQSGLLIEVQELKRALAEAQMAAAGAGGSGGGGGGARSPAAGQGSSSRALSPSSPSADSGAASASMGAMAQLARGQSARRASGGARRAFGPSLA